MHKCSMQKPAVLTDTLTEMVVIKICQIDCTMAEDVSLFYLTFVDKTSGL